MTCFCRVRLKIRDAEPIKLKVGNVESVHFTENQYIKVRYSDLPIYEGSQEITPTAEAQILETDSFRMVGNITINPIPNNYGLITWDGATLTVS